MANILVESKRLTLAFAVFSVAIVVLISFNLPFSANNNLNNVVPFRNASCSYSGEQNISINANGPNAIVSFGSYVYVADFNSSLITVISGTRACSFGSHQVDKPNGLTIATYCGVTFLLVSSLGSSSVQLFLINGYDKYTEQCPNPTNPDCVNNISVAPSLGGIAYNAKLGEVYVSSCQAKAVFVFSIASAESRAVSVNVTKIPVGPNPTWVIYDPLDCYIYADVESNVANYTVVLSGTQEIHNFTSLPSMPLTFDANYSGVVGVAKTGLYVFQGTNPCDKYGFTVSGIPWAISAGPSNYIYVANQAGNNVYVLNSTGISSTIPVGESPQGIHYNPEDKVIYVSDFKLAEVTTIDVSQPKYYNVTFEESGLSAGDTWCVNFNGNSKQSTSSCIEFLHLLPGSYYYSLSGPSNFRSSIQGCQSVTVSGNETVNVAFSQLYTVTFTESGLPSQDTWWVNFNGDNLSASGSQNSIVFTNSVVSGDYSYYIGSPDDYKASPGSGFINVPQAGDLVDITFSPSDYLVTFDVYNYNIVSGKNWTAYIGSLAGVSCDTSVISLGLENGNYNYSIVAPPGFSSIPSAGEFTVDGGPITIYLNFTNTFSFVLTSQNSAISVTAGESVSDLLNVSVTNPNGNAINLIASGVPMGDTFTFSSNSIDHSFDSTFQINTLSSNTPGTIKIKITAESGNMFSNITISLTILPYTEQIYNITFCESGLPQHALWFVDLNGTIKNSTTTFIYFGEINGNYHYNLYSFGYLAAPFSGNILVDNSTRNISIIFSSSGPENNLLSGEFFYDQVLNSSKWFPTFQAGNLFYNLILEFLNLHMYGIKTGVGLEFLMSPNSYIGSYSIIKSNSSFTAPLSASNSFIVYPTDVPQNTVAYQVQLSNSNSNSIQPKFEFLENGSAYLSEGALSLEVASGLSTNLEYTTTFELFNGFMAFLLSDSKGLIAVSMSSVQPISEMGSYSLEFGIPYASSLVTGAGSVGAVSVSANVTSYMTYDVNENIILNETGYNNKTWGWNSSLSTYLIDYANGREFNFNSSSVSSIYASGIPSGDYEIFVTGQIFNLSTKVGPVVESHKFLLIGDPSTPFTTSVPIKFTLSAPEMPEIKPNPMVFPSHKVLQFQKVFVTLSPTGGTGIYSYSWQENGVKKLPFTSNSINLSFNSSGQNTLSVIITATGTYLGLPVIGINSYLALVFSVMPLGYFLGLSTTGGNATLSYHGNANEVLAYSNGNNLLLSGTLGDTSGSIYPGGIVKDILNILGINYPYEGVIGEYNNINSTENILIQPQSSQMFSNLTIPSLGIPSNDWTSLTGKAFNLILSPYTDNAIISNILVAVLSALGFVSSELSSIIPVAQITAFMTTFITRLAEMFASDIQGLYLSGSLSSDIGIAGRLLGNAVSLLKDAVLGSVEGYLEQFTTDSAEQITSCAIKATTIETESTASRISELAIPFLDFIPIGIFVANLLSIAAILFEGTSSEHFAINTETPMEGVAVSGDSNAAPSVITTIGKNSYGYDNGKWQNTTSLFMNSGYNNSRYSYMFPDPNTVTYFVYPNSNSRATNYTITFYTIDGNETVKGSLSPGTYMTYEVLTTNGTINVIAILHKGPSLLPYLVVVLVVLAVLILVGVIIRKRE